MVPVPALAKQDTWYLKLCVLVYILSIIVLLVSFHPLVHMKYRTYNKKDHEGKGEFKAKRLREIRIHGNVRYQPIRHRCHTWTVRSELIHRKEYKYEDTQLIERKDIFEEVKESGCFFVKPIFNLDKKFV